MKGLFGGIGTGLMNFGKNLFGGIGGGFFPPSPDSFRLNPDLPPGPNNFDQVAFAHANKKYKVKKARMDMAGDMFQKFQPKDNYIPGVKKGGGNRMGQFAVVDPTTQWTGEKIPPYSLLGIRRKERR